ncbi:zinc-binding dehydrogenase, partial [Bacillus sp. D-CC]
STGAGLPPAIPKNTTVPPTLTGGDLWNVLTTFEERKQRSTQLFDWIATGKLNIASPTTFSLQDGARAHELLESRKSTGKILLIP